MNQISDGWPEITYRYVEHYFWEPQHLLRSAIGAARLKASGEKGVEAVYRKLRTQEVPLNYLLNILLRIVPSTMRRTLLRPFGVDISNQGLAGLILKTPRGSKFIQPDVHLESDIARVFIEVKVDAPLQFSQVKKYVRLHEVLDCEHGWAKRAYCLFLVKKPLITLKDAKTTFQCCDAATSISKLIDVQMCQPIFGATTWPIFAEALSVELGQFKKRDDVAAEMLAVLIGDLLVDLKKRDLIE